MSCVGCNATCLGICMSECSGSCVDENEVRVHVESAKANEVTAEDSAREERYKNFSKSRFE